MIVMPMHRMEWAFADGGPAHRIRGVLAGLLRPIVRHLPRSPTLGSDLLRSFGFGFGSWVWRVAAGGTRWGFSVRALGLKAEGSLAECRWPPSAPAPNFRSWPGRP